MARENPKEKRWRTNERKQEDQELVRELWLLEYSPKEIASTVHATYYAGAGVSEAYREHNARWDIDDIRRRYAKAGLVTYDEQESAALYHTNSVITDAIKAYKKSKVPKRTRKLAYNSEGEVTQMWETVEENPAGDPGWLKIVLQAVKLRRDLMKATGDWQDEVVTKLRSGEISADAVREAYPQHAVILLRRAGLLQVIEGDSVPEPALEYADEPGPEIKGAKATEGNPMAGRVIG